MGAWRGGITSGSARAGWLLVVIQLACSSDDERDPLQGMAAGQEPEATGSLPTALPMSAPPPPVRVPEDSTAGGGTTASGVPNVPVAPGPSAGGSHTGTEVDIERSEETAGESMTNVGGSGGEGETAVTTDRTRPGGGRPGRTESTTEASLDESTTADHSSGTGSPGDVGAEAGRMAGMTAAHNAVRDAVAMQSLAPLVWSEGLAQYAQEWADELAKDCMPRHRSELSYGENIATFGSTAAGGPGTTAPDAVDGWAAEIDCWEYGEFMRTDSCGAQCVAQLNASGCGHYTQLVWSGTEQVGCGLSQCSRSQGGRTFQFDVWVCNYDPPGNFVGRHPY